MLNRAPGLSAADERYYFQFVIVRQRGLIERFTPYNRGISLDCDAAHVKFEGFQEPGYCQSVAMLSPFAVYFDTHAAIMHSQSRRVKTPCIVGKTNTPPEVSNSPTNGEDDG